MPPGLASLPVELLAEVLRSLELKERQRLALVSHIWRQAANSPCLLPRLSLSLGTDAAGGDSPGLQRSRSCGEWLLLRAAPHVQQLRLAVHMGSQPSWEEEELRGLVQGALMACSGGQLSELDLHLYGNSPFVVGSWITVLSGSLRLHITAKEFHGNSWIPIQADMRQMSLLSELKLTSFEAGWFIKPHARLPAGLTKLVLETNPGWEEGALAPQIGTLGALKELSLHSFAHPADGYAPLRHLRSLTRLHFYHCINLPSNLRLLCSLEELVLEDVNDCHGAFLTEADGALVSSAIGHLTRLTSLCMDSAPGILIPPAALTSLQRLRRLGRRDLRGDSYAQLPPGAWLEQLHVLAAWAYTAAYNLPTLAAVTALTELRLDHVAADKDEAAAVICWAGSLPHLRRLCLHHRPEQSMPASVAAAAEAAQAANASLVVDGKPAFGWAHVEAW